MDKLYASRHRKRILDRPYFHPISGADPDLIRDKTADVMNNDNPNDGKSRDRELARQFIGYSLLRRHQHPRINRRTLPATCFVRCAHRAGLQQCPEIIEMAKV
jgi:hypothetical protein